MKKLYLLIPAMVLCGVLAFAQDSPGGQMENPNNRAAADANTIKGCVTGSDGNYMLIQNDTGTTYSLVAKDRRLRKHVGQEVAVSGKLLKESDATGTSSGPSLKVSYLDVLSKQCKTVVPPPQ